MIIKGEIGDRVKLSESYLKVANIAQKNKTRLGIIKRSITRVGYITYGVIWDGTVTKAYYEDKSLDLVKDLYTHVEKGGVYQKLYDAEVQINGDWHPCVVYMNTETNNVFVRDKLEFDNRLKLL